MLDIEPVNNKEEKIDNALAKLKLIEEQEVPKEILKLLPIKKNITSRQIDRLVETGGRELLYQQLVIGMNNKVPVIEVDGVPGTGKDRLTLDLYKALQSGYWGLQVDMMKLSGFVESSKEKERIASNYPYSQTMQPEWKSFLELLENINPGKNIDRSTSGEESYHLLQERLLVKLNELHTEFEIPDTILLGNRGHLTRAKAWLEYGGIYDNPFKTIFKHKYLRADQTSAIMIPMPRLILCLTGDKSELIRRVSNDSDKPEQVEDRIASIEKNYNSYVVLVEKFQIYFPGRVVTMDASGTPETNLQKSIDILKEKNILW